MENKKEEKEVTVYNIPGVIIPEQMTDNGIIKGTKSMAEQQQTNNTVSPPMNNQTIQNQKSVPSNNNTQVIKNTSPTSNQNNMPINQVLSPPPSQESPQPLPITPSTIPQIPIDKQEREKKSKDKNTRKNNTSIYIMIIVVLLGGLAYFIYNDFIAPKEEIDPVKELERKRSINKNSFLVQKLYSYVNLEGCNNQINFFYGENNTVLAKDLSNEVKNYLAYRQLLNKDIKKENCSNYTKALHKNDDTHLWYCGDEYLYSKNENFNDEKSLTNRIDEEILKKQVETMFGPASYKEVTFAISSSIRYLYDDKTSSYILQSFYGKDTCKGYTNKLEQAYRKGNDITIVVKVTNNENKKIQMFNYTFTESEDGNYYFNTLNKQDA